MADIRFPQDTINKPVLAATDMLLIAEAQNPVNYRRTSLQYIADFIGYDEDKMLAVEQEMRKSGVVVYNAEQGIPTSTISVLEWRNGGWFLSYMSKIDNQTKVILLPLSCKVCYRRNGYEDEYYILNDDGTKIPDTSSENNSAEVEQQFFNNSGVLRIAYILTDSGRTNPTTNNAQLLYSNAGWTYYFRNINNEINNITLPSNCVIFKHTTTSVTDTYPIGYYKLLADGRILNLRDSLLEIEKQAILSGIVAVDRYTTGNNTPSEEQPIVLKYQDYGMAFVVYYRSLIDGSAKNITLNNNQIIYLKNETGGKPAGYYRLRNNGLMLSYPLHDLQQTMQFSGTLTVDDDPTNPDPNFERETGKAKVYYSNGWQYEYDNDYTIENEDPPSFSLDYGFIVKLRSTGSYFKLDNGGTATEVAFTTI